MEWQRELCKGIFADVDRAPLESAAALRALAHPLRPRLLGLLRSRGPATATKLAEHFGLSSGDTSYHLRQLARFGLIEEEDTGSRRERWWRATAPATTFAPKLLRRREAREAMRALQQQRIAIHAQAIDDALLDDSVPPRWREALATNDFQLSLTLDELGALLTELHAVVKQYSDREDASGAEGSRMSVRLVIDAVPLVRENG